MRNILMIFAYISFFHAFPQSNIVLEGLVVDSISYDKLQYVSIMVLNKALGTSSNSDGTFSLNIPKEFAKDTLVFSHLGYYPLKVPISKLNYSIIKLSPNSIDLKEIVLNNIVHKKKSISLNSFKKRKTAVLRSTEPYNGKGNLWIPYRAKEPTIETIFFPYKSSFGTSPKLTKVRINFITFRDSTKFKLRIFHATKEMAPSNDALLSEMILTVTKKKSYITIELGKEHIQMNENGIFVGVETLIIPENLRVIENDLGMKAKTYSPFLSYTTINEKYPYYIYSKGQWLKESKKVRFTSKRNLYYKPAINLELEVDDI